MANNSNAAKLRELWNLPETRRFVEQTLHKLAHAPRTFYGERVAPAQDERGAALLRPLLDDLLLNESFLQVRGPADQTAEWTLLVRLPADRLPVWRAGLTELMRLWGMGAAATNTVEGFAAWEVKGTDARARMRCVEAGQWLVLGIGRNDLPEVGEAARRIKGAGRPIRVASDYWLQTELNLPRLVAALDLSPAIQWPHAELSVIGKGENLRSSVRMVFPEPVTGPLDPWNIPTNVINDPLVSFTAARGVSPWFRNCALLQQLGLTPAPNDVFLWAQGRKPLQRDVPFQTFIAFPLKDAASKLQRAEDRAAPLLGTNWQRPGLTQVSWLTNRHQLFWRGLPMITPFLRPAEYQGTELVVGGLFPPSPLTNPPPAELLSQFSDQSKLVYYDWEIGEARLFQWRVMAQLFAVLANKPQFTTNTAGLPWLMAMEPKLGNTVTEITADSPKEWSLVRKSQIGFTGVELVALTRWLESIHFPRLGFELPPDRALQPASMVPPPAANAPTSSSKKPSEQ